MIKKPKGVVAWSLFVIFHGLIQLFAYSTSSRLDFLKPFYILIAFTFFLSGWFLLKMKNWARILFNWQMVYILLITGRGVLKTPPTKFVHLAAYIVLVVVPAILGIYYFNIAKIKDLFIEQ